MGLLGSLGKFAASAGGGNVIAAGISGLASLLGGIGANKSQKETNATNLQIARENNAQQLAIARENNAAQYAAMMDNNKWSRDTAIEMFNLENAYNTPSAQRQRLLEAGLNPAVIMNGSGASVAANASAPSAAGSTISPSMPSFVTPTLTAPPPVMLGAIDAIAQLAKASADYQQGRKTGKEANRVNEVIDAQIQDIMARVKNTESQTAYQNVVTYLETKFGSQKRAADILLSYKQAYLAGAQGDNQKAQELLTKAQEELAKSQKTRYDAETPKVLQQMDESIKLLQEKQQTELTQQEVNRASAADSRAKAALSKALEKTENELRGSKKSQIENEIENGKYGRAVSMLETYMKAAGYGEPIWNLGAGLADTVGDWIRGLFGQSKQVEEFINFFKKQVSE